MAKLEWKRSDLQPHVIDERESELIREYRQLIVKSVDEWMERMFATDRSAFLEGQQDALDTNESGYLRTKTLPDMWRMLREQTLVAGGSARADVAEGVIDAMFVALKSRQSMWQKMVDEESAKIKNPSADPESLQVLQDWLVAIANDQIMCIDDNEEASQLGYLTRFQRDFEPLATPKYISHAHSELEGLRDGFVDLSTHCISTFVSIIFKVDFKSTVPEFFTPRWYNEFGMKRIVTTFDDYIGDYARTLHHSLLDILVEELSDELLVAYLASVRNKGAKFRRTEPFTEKFKNDVLTVFQFFQNLREKEDMSALTVEFATIKSKWRVVDYLVRMLESDKAAVPAVYESFKMDYWDLQMSWVESALRTRDDYDRGLLNSVKVRAGEIHVGRGPETIMGKVK